MAGKELKAAEKTVLKHSRDGVVEKNLVNNSEKRISEHTKEAVLKGEKPADISFEKRNGEDIAHVEPKKPRPPNVQSGKNNSEYEREEQAAKSEKAELSVNADSADNSKQAVPRHKPRPPEQPSPKTVDYKNVSHISEQAAVITEQKLRQTDEFNFKDNAPVEEHSNNESLSADFAENPSRLKTDSTYSALKNHSALTDTLVAAAVQSPIRSGRKSKVKSHDKTDALSEKSNDVQEEKPSSDVTAVNRQAAVQTENPKSAVSTGNTKSDVPKKERTQESLSLSQEHNSKLTEKKAHNTLQEHSSTSKALADDASGTMLKFEKAAAEKKTADVKKTRRLEKKAETSQKRLARLEEKNEKILPALIRQDEKRISEIDKRIGNAEKKLPHQCVFHVQKEFNPQTQKSQSKLRLEKEVKPLRSSVVAKSVKRANETLKATINGAVHNEISKYEQEDTTLKAAHDTEKTAESALRFTKAGIKAKRQRLKEKPHEKVSKLKFQRETAEKKLNEHKALLENSSLRKDENAARKALKKSQQKLQRQNLQKKSAHTASQKAKRAIEKAEKAVTGTIAKNKTVIIIGFALLGIFSMLGTVSSSLLSAFSDTGGMVIGSTYTSEDEDIYAANNFMDSLEALLESRLENIKSEYPDWDEYRVNADDIGHDPYELISYLSAMETDFKYDSDTIARIKDIFDELYTMELTSIHEIHSMEYTTVDEDGNEVTETEYYDYYILEVTLTANDWESVVKPRLEAAGVYDVYLLMQETHGNKPNLF